MDAATRFSECSPPLSRVVLDCVDTQGFTHMTPVQQSVIPLFMSNKDVCVQVRAATHSRPV